MSVSWLPARWKRWPSSVLRALGSRCADNSRRGHSPGKEGPLRPGDHHGSWSRAEGLEAVTVAGRPPHGLEMSLQIRGRAEEGRQPWLERMEILGARGELAESAVQRPTNVTETKTEGKTLLQGCSEHELLFDELFLFLLCLVKPL